MADALRIVTVQPDGDAGRELGSLQLSGDRIEASAGIADETVEMLRRRSGLDDVALFDRLRRDGWSNGQIMVVPAST